MRCASCGNEFVDVDNGLFITCPACQLPDKPRRPRKAPRFDVTKGSSRDRRSSEQKELTRETKFGIDR